MYIHRICNIHICIYIGYTWNVLMFTRYLSTLDLKSDYWQVTSNAGKPTRHRFHCARTGALPVHRDAVWASLSTCHVPATPGYRARTRTRAQRARLPRRHRGSKRHFRGPLKTSRRSFPPSKRRSIKTESGEVPILPTKPPISRSHHRRARH